MIGFADTDGGSHALLVLVDHNLSGRAKDAWLADDLDQTVTAWRTTQDEHIQIEEVPVDEALSRLHDAMARTDAAPSHTDGRTDDFGEHRAPIWGRLRRAGLGPGRVEDRCLPPGERPAVVAGFLTSERGREVVADHEDDDRLDVVVDLGQ